MTPLEAIAPTKKNRAHAREVLQHWPDTELVAACASQPDTATGVEAAVILAERRASRAERDAAEAEAKHKALLDAINTPHWTQTPGFWVAVIGAVAAVIAAWPILSPPKQYEPQAMRSAPASASMSPASSPGATMSASSPPLKAPRQP